MDAHKGPQKSAIRFSPARARFGSTELPDDLFARWQMPTAILAATLITYSATLALGFVFDDHVLIVTNDSIRSWHYFPGYFTSHIWSFRYPHLLANYYRPLFLTWLRVNDMLFGLHAWGWHLTSVLAHVLVTYLVYRLSLRFTRNVAVAGAAGMLFGLHPVHAEAVADITSIQEPLSTLFILGTVLAFCKRRESDRPRRWLAVSLVLTAAALLSKESGMVLPILIGSYAWIADEEDGRESPPPKWTARFFPRLRAAFATSIPYWVVVLAFVPVRVWALKGFAHVITPLSLSQEIFTLPSVLLFYLRLLVWPFGLSCYYDTPYVSTASWRGFMVPALLSASVALALAFWYRTSRRTAPQDARAIAFATVLMILTVLPVLNFRFLPAGEIAHDRYVYLPSVGFVILVPLALRRLLGRALDQPEEWNAKGFNRHTWGLLAAIILCCGLGFATARQTLFWSDDLTLNFRAHQIAPRSVYATTSLAAAVAQHGMDASAMNLYRQALAVQPEFWRANVNLAYLYYAHNDYPEAARYFARACAADPTDGDQFLYLGMTLLREGRVGEAEKALRTALLVRPHGKNYHLGLGMVLRAEGNFPEASQELRAELAEDPQNAQARGLLEEIAGRLPASSAASSSKLAPEQPGISTK